MHIGRILKRDFEDLFHNESKLIIKNKGLNDKYRY